jgi:hypothetical protein
MIFRIGMGSEGQQRADIIRLLSDREAERWLGEMSWRFNPKTEEQRDARMTDKQMNEYVDEVDKRDGNPSLNSGQFDEMASFIRLEYLRKRIDDQDVRESEDVFEDVATPAAEQFLRSHHGMRIDGSRVYYRNILSPEGGMAELARQGMEAFPGRFGLVPFGRGPSSVVGIGRTSAGVARPDIAFTFGPLQKIVLPIHESDGLAGVAVGTVTVKEDGTLGIEAEIVKRGDPGYPALSQMVVDRFGQRRLHPLDHLSYHPSLGTAVVQRYDRAQSDPAKRYSPAFKRVALFQLSEEGLLRGLSPSRQGGLVLERMDFLAREVGWSSIEEPANAPE